ncbi:MAG: ABC transporter ATP-binding protein [Rhizobiales bacterium]|nr:ABC transporter ATP-binding protein [Hyphomicrobiales bacterium]
MANIGLHNVEKYFGDNYVIRQLNLEIEQGEFVVLLGPSGCGKTTTLRAIAGLEDINGGTITIDGKEVQDLGPGHRDIAFVFQLFALYPHLTAFDNIAFPLRATGTGKNEIDRQVNEVAKALQIEHLLKKRPSVLSGGDMQRVAIGRALVRRPKALLMDEPIGALDAQLREDMRTELKRLHIENEATTVYVTHDQVEAMSLADRIAIMNDGILQQVGSPTEVYLNPVNLFVAQFVGSPVMNIVSSTIQTGKSGTNMLVGEKQAGFAFSKELEAKITKFLPKGHGLKLGVRPEAVLLSGDKSADACAAEVHAIEPLGAYDIVDIKVGGELFRARTSSGYVDKPGGTIWAKLDETQTHFFDADSGDSLKIRLEH